MSVYIFTKQLGSYGCRISRLKLSSLDDPWHIQKTLTFEYKSRTTTRNTSFFVSSYPLVDIEDMLLSAGGTGTRNSGFGYPQSVLWKNGGCRHNKAFLYFCQIWWFFKVEECTEDAAELWKNHQICLAKNEEKPSTNFFGWFRVPQNQILGTHSTTNASCFFVKQTHWFKNREKDPYKSLSIKKIVAIVA